MLITDEYLELQEKYVKVYGNDTIVLMQVGSFYECYAVDNEIERTNSDRIHKIADILNIQKTKKDKKKAVINRSNPFMIGVPIWSIDKYIQMLLNANYTAVIVEQVTEPPDCKRKVTNIHSPGTTLDYTNNSITNNLMSIYIESVKDQIFIGNSVIDVSTGVNTIYETYSVKNNNDKIYPLDETYRFIKTYNPREIIIIYDTTGATDAAKNNSSILNENYLITYLELSNAAVHFINKKDRPEYSNINFQTKFLEKIFKNQSSLSVIEYLDLERHSLGTLSYIYLLNFAYEHNEQIITKINKPEIHLSNKYLLLTNNAIYQLNVLSNTNQSMANRSFGNNDNTCNTYNTCKYGSLYRIINKTSTNMGARYLRERLLNPIIDSIELNKRYDYVESMFGVCDDIENYLKKISDLERIHRKISLAKLEPADFFSLDYSYDYVLELLKYDGITSDLKPSEKTIADFTEFIEVYKKTFNLDIMFKYHCDNIKESIFREGISTEIDSIDQIIKGCNSNVKIILSKFSEIVGETSSKGIFKYEFSEKEGYHIHATKKRCDVLKKKLLNFPSNYNLINNGTHSDTIYIKPQSIEFKKLSNNKTLVTSKTIQKINDTLRSSESKMGSLCSKLFKEKLLELDECYNQTLKEIAHFIGIVDLYKTIAKVSRKYSYTRPIIHAQTNEDFSQFEDYSQFIDAKDLRHPIIERIISSEYIPNDIFIGNIDTPNTPDTHDTPDTPNPSTSNSERHLNGILLYGTNASGKSSLMKAVGLNLILAQAGFFTAASSFRFTPYHYLFTRILNNDNIFKGESSFAVEMSELRGILKRANNRSLVLGDELCSGTESISAQAIFAASVLKLDERNTSFIFATHLHQLMEMETIRTLENTKAFHLKVIYDAETETLIYNRKLAEGNGPTTYGLEVCKAMDLDANFIKLADTIRRELMNVPNEILANKKSKYNANVFVDLCEICQNKAEDTHHIKFQCNANEDNIIDNYIQKNTESNLVPLCKKCHNDVHYGSLVINGYIDTSNGVKLCF